MSHRFLALEHGFAAVTFAAVAAVSAAGCGASQPKQSGDENNFDSPPSGTSSASADEKPKWSDKSSAKDKKDEDFSDEQKAQMEIALRRGGDKAAQCVSVVADAARGEGEVKVTFDGTKGRITEAQVGPPWAGTPAESCIKRSFIGEYSLRFEGQLEVPYTVKLPAKAGEPEKGAKGPKKK